MNLEPLEDRLVVLPDEANKMTAGGLHMPDIAKDKPQQGEVVSVGEGRTKEDGTILPTKSKVGDKVLFTPFSGSEIELEGKKHIVIREIEVLAIVRE